VLSEVLFAELGIRRPDLAPDVVVGDVNSTLACALVTAKLRAPLAHVEAGLRSCDRLMDTLLANAGRAATSGMLARLGPRPRQYGIPCLTLRDRTERPITVAEDTDRLAGREPDRIVTAAPDVIAGPCAPRAGRPTHCGRAD